MPKSIKNKTRKLIVSKKKYINKNTKKSKKLSKKSIIKRNKGGGSKRKVIKGKKKTKKKMKGGTGEGKKKYHLRPKPGMGAILKKFFDTPDEITIHQMNLIRQDIESKYDSDKVFNPVRYLRLYEINGSEKVGAFTREFKKLFIELHQKKSVSQKRVAKRRNQANSMRPKLPKLPSNYMNLFFTEAASKRIGKKADELMEVNEENVDIIIVLTPQLKKLFFEYFWRDMCHDGLYNNHANDYGSFLTGIQHCMSYFYRDYDPRPEQIETSEKIALQESIEKILQKNVEYIGLTKSTVLLDDRLVSVDQFQSYSTYCFLSSSFMVINIPKREDKGWYLDKFSGSPSQTLEIQLAEKNYLEGELLENVKRTYIDIGYTNIILKDSETSDTGFELTYKLNEGSSDRKNLETIFRFFTSNGVVTRKGILKKSAAARMVEGDNHIERFLKASQKTWGDLGIALRAMRNGEIFLTGDKSLAAFILDYWNISLGKDPNTIPLQFSVNEKFVLILEEMISDTGENAIRPILTAYCIKGKEIRTYDHEILFHQHSELIKKEESYLETMKSIFDINIQQVLFLFARLEILWELVMDYQYDVSRHPEVFIQYLNNFFSSLDISFRVQDNLKAWLFSNLGRAAINATKKSILLPIIETTLLNQDEIPYYQSLTDVQKKELYYRIKTIDPPLDDGMLSQLIFQGNFPFRS